VWACVRFFLCLTILGSTLAAASEPHMPPPSNASNALSSALAIPKPILRHMIRDSGRIFAGAVIKIERVDPGPTSGIATIQITFRGEDPIRGVRRGQVLQIREWSGLWQTGESYRVGERVLLFLYPPSKLGLTSPVGGTSGRLQIDRKRRVDLKNASGSGLRRIELKTFAAALRRAARE